MKRTIIMTLEVDFEDLPDAKRAAIAKECEEHAEELPSLADYEASELADPFSYLDTAIDTQDFLAGSELIADLTGSRIIDSKYKEAEEQ
ncbi:hypothetical protein [Thalassospira xiamenensis]|mgnify:FL=1|jgi:hypothetical protein|uniref:hypothetical protein n=1 Tax=Thalassospira xiamenensis TaxID=220697 RepID=UPI000E95459A|nr:hypothetical protein [Thalassospira xiamenensis]HBN47621.1 hypothetical protein [Thalassospira sp.]|tara:strand:+ start:691 stop:957 length:267 start_codon:yes stop_codon:yes gene_type:complete